jgi:hypothetical protein
MRALAAARFKTLLNPVLSAARPGFTRDPSPCLASP